MTKWGFSLQWPDMVSHLTTRCLGETSDHMSAWPEAWPHVNLTQSLIFRWRGICDVYYFYTHLKLWRLIYLFILLFFWHIFCLGMLGLDCGWSDMAWQMSPTPREGISFKCSKTYFWSTYHSLSLPRFFQHSQCFRDWDPSEIYIYLSFLSKCGTFRWLSLSTHWSFCDIFCLVIYEEDALVVKYISCKLWIFLTSTGKHYMFCAQKSDIVWCEILRSYCYFNRHHHENPTVVLQFLFYIKLIKTITHRCRLYCLFSIL